MFPGLCSTAVRSANPYIVDASFRHLSTDLIHGTVGVCHEHDRAPRFQEFFFERVEKSERCFACSRRTYDKEEVLCLLHAQCQIIEIPVIAFDMPFLIHLRLTL